MNLRKFFPLVLLFSLSSFVNRNLWAAQPLEEKIAQNNTKTSNYVHEQLDNAANLFQNVDKENEEHLIRSLLKMHKEGVAKSTKKSKIPVYFVVGPAGSGKSTFIFSLQGNEVIKKEEWDDDDNWDEIKDVSDDCQLKFNKTVDTDTPEMGLSADEVTKGSKVYYVPKYRDKIAFCDTEGFLGERKAETNTEKLLSIFSPWFALKANKVGGIVVMMSASDIDSARGKNFRVCAKFIQKYFDLGVKGSEIRRLKKSILLLITKGDKKKKTIAKQLALIIQKSYKDHLSPKKNQLEKKTKQEENIGDLKTFFSIFLKKDVPEDQIDDITKFSLDRENVDFFCPYPKKSVQKTMKKLLSLSPLPSQYLYSGDSALFQYLNGKLRDRSNKINKKVIELFDWQLKNKLQNILLKDDPKEISAFLKELKKEYERLQHENEAILTNELLEEIFSDRHLEPVPLSHQGRNSFLEANKEPYKYLVKDFLYDEIIKKGVIEGGNHDHLGKRVLTRVGAAFSAGVLIGWLPFLAPISAAYSSANHWYKGYLRRTFIYNGENPVYRIEIEVTDGTVKWEKPSQSFLKQKFIQRNSERKVRPMNNINLKQQFDAKGNKGIKLDSWEIYHVSDFKKPAQCYITFYGKKKRLKESNLGVECNKSKIDFIKKCISYSENDEFKNKDLLNKKIVSSEGVIRKRKEKLLKYLEEVNMMYFWSKCIFKDKSSRAKLITQYTKDFEKAIGVKVIEDLDSYSNQNEGLEDEKKDDDIDDNSIAYFGDNMQNDYQSYGGEDTLKVNDAVTIKNKK